MRRKGSGKSFKRPGHGRGKGGYDLEAAFSCQPNEDGMNSWSWWPKMGSSLSPVLMKEDIHQLDCEVKTAYGSHVRYAQYADDFLFAIKPCLSVSTFAAL